MICGYSTLPYCGHPFVHDRVFAKANDFISELLTNIEQGLDVRNKDVITKLQNESLENLKDATSKYLQKQGSPAVSINRLFNALFTYVFSRVSNMFPLTLADENTVNSMLQEVAMSFCQREEEIRKNIQEYDCKLYAIDIKNTVVKNYLYTNNLAVKNEKEVEKVKVQCEMNYIVHEIAEQFNSRYWRELLKNTKLDNDDRIKDILPDVKTALNKHLFRNTDEQDEGISATLLTFATVALHNTIMDEITGDYLKRKITDVLQDIYRKDIQKAVKKLQQKKQQQDMSAEQGLQP